MSADLCEGALEALAGDRAALARAITLIESRRPDHQVLARALVQAVLPLTGRAVRLGITGVPGVGKSTFIEALGLFLIGHGHRVAVLRTFSKIYGLGGLRIGWGYGPKHIVDVLNRIRGPFNLSNTQLETAEAAVRDQDYVTRCRADNARMRHWLAEALAEHGVSSDTSLANFILARFASAEEAEACDIFLQSQGLLLRRVASYKLPHCLRITVGDEAGCRRVAHAVAQFKGVK